MNHLFFSARDGRVLRMLELHVDSHRARPSQGRCEATFVFITGDAGTGKTMIQNAMRYVSNLKPMFVGSTNVAGNVLRKTFVDNEMHVSNHMVYSTAFQQFGRITPKTWSQCMKMLYSNVPREVYTAGYKKASEFYEAIWPNLRKVCLHLFQKQYNGIRILSRGDYHKFRRTVEFQLGRDAPVRQIHEATMKRILGVYPRRQIPDKLVFDTFVFDEAGRLTCSWALVDVGMYYTVHNMYDTGMDKPTVIVSGSCTQQNSFNDSCFQGCSGEDICGHDKIPINDYSMITMISKNCLIYDDATFVKVNKHNRRTKGGDLERSANLALFRNCLEMDEPVPESVMEFIKNHMSVTEEEFYKRKCIHLCMTHEDCKKVLAKDEVDPVDIVLVEESMTAAGDKWPSVLYGCTAPAGAMFKSANYTQGHWVKEVLMEPHSLGAKYKFGFPDENKKNRGVGKKNQDKKQVFSCWLNKRKFYVGRPYTTTHSARCMLKSIRGSWKDFMCDLEEYEHLLEDNRDLVAEMVTAMATSLMYSNMGDADALQTLCEKTMSKSASSDELLQSMHDLKSLMGGASDPAHKDVFYACSAESKANLIVPKGENVFFLGRVGKSMRGPVQVRLGKTFEVLMYQATVKSDQSVESFAYSKKSKVRGARGRVMEKEEKEIEELPPSCDFSDDDDDEMGVTPSEVIQMELNSEECAPGPLSDEASGDFTVLDICPLKLNLVSTVAASQGMTINTVVYGQVNKVMSAYTLIVMSTRSSSSDDIWFYFSDKQKKLSITPLDPITKATMQILYLRSIRDTGVL